MPRTSPLQLTPASRVWLPSTYSAVTPKKHRAAVYVADDIDGWMRTEGTKHNGLLVERPFDGRWEGLHAEVDEAVDRWPSYALCTQVDNADLASNLDASVKELLEAAALPAALAAQVRDDACRMGLVVGELCAFAPLLEVKLEIFGENSCSRWHQDYYAGRAIITYTGGVGTEYLDDSNVDFHELEHCGNNDCIIRDKRQVRRVMPGDMLFMKGRRFPGAGAGALVHKSPEKRYHPDGRVVHRLLLKIDVPAPGARQPVAGIQWERGGPP